MRISDWSSDVCSSDLLAGIRQGQALTIRFVGVPYIVITSPHMGDREMSPLRLDHVTLSSGRMDDTVAFYGEILRMRPGFRPPLEANAVKVGGVWLSPHGRDYPLLHITEPPTQPRTPGPHQS